MLEVSLLEVWLIIACLFSICLNVEAGNVFIGCRCSDGVIFGSIGTDTQGPYISNRISRNIESISHKTLIACVSSEKGDFYLLCKDLKEIVSAEERAGLTYDTYNEHTKEYVLPTRSIAMQARRLIREEYSGSELHVVVGGIDDGKRALCRDWRAEKVYGSASQQSGSDGDELRQLRHSWEGQVSESPESKPKPAFSVFEVGPSGALFEQSAVVNGEGDYLINKHLSLGDVTNRPVLEIRPLIHHLLCDPHSTPFTHPATNLMTSSVDGEGWGPGICSPVLTEVRNSEKGLKKQFKQPIVKWITNP